jgi:anti-sigma regulatory factor (Ser/Thr protein kinase)
VKISRSFPAEVGSIPAARRFVADAVGDVPGELRDAISVMVSELAMNAVQYARTRFEVRAEIGDGTLRVEVTDAGAGLPELQPFPPASSPRGRGLLIVHLLSDEWGVIPAVAGNGKSVWFDIALTVQPGSPVHLMPGTADQ